VRSLFFLLVLGSLLLQPATEGMAASVLFRNTRGIDIIPGWDHVGLEYNGWVWESHPGYNYPGDIWHGIPPHIAYDPDLNAWCLVPQVSGVQHNHSRGSFRWDSCRTGSSPTDGFEAITIDSGLAASMDFEALLVQGSPYPNVVGNPFRLSAARQKGSEGEFTCVGLVEYLAEAADYNGGEGFIPDSMEHWTVCGQEISILTPQMLHDALAQHWTPANSQGRLRGVADPVDFILTDPLGRRTGYTALTGLLNEIPGMSYSGNGEFEELMLSDPTPGRYRVVLTGLGTSAFMAIGDGSGAGLFFDGFLAAGGEVKGSFVLGSRPRLVLQRVGNAVRLLWPTNFAGFQLEIRSGLLTQNAWLTVTNQTDVIGEDFAVTLDSRVGTGFYRLRR
jgi:hypothetical protein